MLKTTLKIVLFSIVFALAGCKTTKTSTQVNTEETQKPVTTVLKSDEKTNVRDSVSSNKGTEYPRAQREFRAAWVATVANINWPSKPGLSTDFQKKEAIKILDAAEKANLNAIILQVRPQADALYDSKLEPWSYYLTGKSGKAPAHYYDPLKFWVEEAHKRGMELHAWLNPYRAHHTTAGDIGEQSVVKKHPDWVVELKNGMWWMDPGNKQVQEFSAEVVKDIVSRYDVDGIHFDDYFYPYPSYNGKKDFPDDKTWNQYLANGGELSKADWRRKNVNDFIQRVAKVIKEEKSYVKFGISPFGIWRPDVPAGIKGMDQYDVLYADAKLWLNNGWIDYLTPQLYWPTREISLSFPVLLGWWDSENVTSRHLWPGINLTLEDKEENKGEVTSQIMISRGILHDDPGAVLWNIGQLMRNKELDSVMRKGAYLKKSLVPASPWLDDEPPAQPKLTKIEKSYDNLYLSWNSANPDVFRWVVYYRYKDSDWNYKILNENAEDLILPSKNEKEKTLQKLGMTSVDRTGNESNFEEITLR